MNTPDIEIYVKNTSAQMILTWLNSHFNKVNIPLKEEDISTGKTVCGFLKHENNSTNSIKAVITPQAAGKAFTSIWFQSDITGWKNDEECAMSFVEQFDIEIRCSAGGWQESEEENSEQWWLITQKEKKLIRW